MINVVKSTRVVARSTNIQRRSIMNWLMNLPDTVMQQKAVQMKGGICQGADNPTWLKQPGDVAKSGVLFAFTGLTLMGVAVGFSNLSNGTGKND